MSRRLDVLQAVKALVAQAVPGAKVMGLDGEDAAQSAIPAGGRIVVRAGQPDLVETTFSPLTYYWDHGIPIELAANRATNMSGEDVIDGMAIVIGAAIEADRTLGGLVDWLDAALPETDDLPVTDERGNLVARPPRVAELILTASYATSGPHS